MKFIIYLDRQKQFRWKLKASNGRIIADCAEGFKSKQGCQYSIANMLGVATAPVIDLTPTK